MTNILPRVPWAPEDIALEPNSDMNTEPELISLEEVTLESDLYSPGGGSPRDGPLWTTLSTSYGLLLPGMDAEYFAFHSYGHPDHWANIG